MNYCTPKQVPSGLDMQLCPLPPAIDLLQLSSGEFAWCGAAGFELPIPVLSEDSWDWEMKIDLKSCFQPRVHVVFLIKHNQKGRHFRIGFHGYFCAISKATHLNNILVHGFGLPCLQCTLHFKAFLHPGTIDQRLPVR